MLRKHEIKVWALQDQDLVSYREPLKKLKSLLHPDDAAAISNRLKLFKPIKAEQSLAARYMIWRTLAAHLGENWETLRGPSMIDQSYQDIYWSITHTEGLTMVALLLEQRVGLDVEFIPTRRDVLKIAERYFDEEERALLFSSSPYMAEENFFRMWTAKEAYYKYRAFGNFYTLLGESCLYLNGEKDVWGLKWERDFFFTVVTDKNPNSNLEVKPFSEKLFD